MEEHLSAHLELADLSDEDFVARAYRLLVRRPPDPDGRARALDALADGRLSRATLLAELAASEEFESLRTLDDAIARADAARRTGQEPPSLGGPASSDERLIEIPWVLSRLGDAKRVLDVGYANAEPAYLAALVNAEVDDLVGVDLAERPVPGLRSVVADARSLPFDSGSFDAVICISTLEHVGRDNRLYGGAEEHDERGIATALEELRRVVAPSGRLLVTVPTGTGEDHGSFVQLPPDEWLGLYERAGLVVVEHEVYGKGAHEWSWAEPAEVASLSYGEHGAAAVLCAVLSPAQLRQRARRGLARLAGRRP